VKRKSERKNNVYHDPHATYVYEVLLLRDFGVGMLNAFIRPTEKDCGDA
jgi:hypothetical protein